MTMDKDTLVYRLKELKRSKPEWEAIVSYDEAMVRSSVTAEELYDLCTRFAYTLKEQGVLPGDYVVTTVPLSIESFIVTLGIVFAGAIPANLELSFLDGEVLTFSMQTIKPRLMIVQDEPWNEELKFIKANFDINIDPTAMIGEVTSAQVPTLESLMLVKKSGGRGNSFLEQLAASQGEYVYDGITSESTAWLTYTTGTEKDMIRMTDHSHRAVLNFSDNLHQLKQIKGSSRLYENSLYWLTATPGDIIHGITRVIPDKWMTIHDYPAMLLKIIETEQVITACIQPLNLKPILDIQKERGNDKPLLDLAELAGMPMTRRHLQELRPIGRRFAIMYGSHEVGTISGHVINDSEIDTFKDFDNGPLFPGTQFRLVDRDNKDVTMGERGRVLVKTSNMFKDFAGEPGKASAKFNEDGWFVTNDQAYMDPVNKHVFIGGRIDAVILHGMYMLFPSWLEEMAAPHPGIKEVIAVPIPDVILFHAIAICIIRKEGQTVSKEEIVELMSKRIIPSKAHYVRPKTIVFFEKFPAKPDGSVDRIKLSDMVAEMVESGKA